jgi:hypothetical protein
VDCPTIEKTTPTSAARRDVPGLHRLRRP